MRPQKNRGGTLTETTLWTNSAPTSDFGAQTVALSQSIDNFKSIAIYFRMSKSNSNESFVTYTVDEVKKFINSGVTPYGVIAVRTVDSATDVREIIYVNNTNIRIENAYAMRGASMHNQMTIPTKIIGLS